MGGFFKRTLSRTAGLSFLFFTPALFGITTKPHVSFSLIANKAGEFQSGCESEAIFAKQNGFDSVSLVPTFGLENPKEPQKEQVIIPFVHRRDNVLKPTVYKDEIKNCLNILYHQGLRIYYKPHLDNYPQGWRAHFDFDPIKVHYEEAVLGEFYEFLEQISNEQRLPQKTEQRSEQKSEQAPPIEIQVVLATENDLSLKYYPSSWQEVIKSIREKTSAYAAKNILVRVGINTTDESSFNYNPKSKEEHITFLNLLLAVDFIAPSMYGSWSLVFQDKESEFERRKNEMIGRTILQGKTYFSFSEYQEYLEKIKNKFAFGEFGVGSDFSRSWDYETPVKNKKKYIKDRRFFYQTMLSWLKDSKLEYLNVWTFGIHDPFGFKKYGGAVTPIYDDQLKKWFLAYQQKF